MRTDRTTYALPMVQVGHAEALPAPDVGAAPGPRRTRYSLWWTPPLFVLLVVLVPAFIALQPSSEPRDQVFWVQAVLIAYAGAAFALAVGAREIQLLRTVFWLFTYTAMGIAPFAQAVLGMTPIAQIGDRTDLLTATVLTLIGCVAFDVGNRVRARRASAPARVRQVHPTGTAALVLLALLGSAFLVASLGLVTFFTSRQGINAGFVEAGFSGESEAGRAMVRAVGTVPVLMAWLVLTRLLMTRRHLRRLPSVWLAWATCLAVQAVVNNPISNPRFWFLTVAVSAVLVLTRERLQLFRLTMVSALAAALLLFPLADYFRYENGPSGRYQGAGWLELVATKDYDQMTMFANTVSYVEDASGHTLGRQLLGAVFFWFPRSMWPDKPIDSGVEVGIYMNNVNTNLSEAIWAELWLDFGVVGMALGLLLLGVACARADSWYASALTLHPTVTSIGMVLVPVLAGYSFILLRGSLLQAMGRLGMVVACTLLVGAVASVHRFLLERDR